MQAAAQCLAAGDVTEAARRLEALVAAVPAYPAAHVLLAKAYEANGQTEAALAMWHRAHVLVPNSPLVRRERQRLLDAQVRRAAQQPGEVVRTPGEDTRAPSIAAEPFAPSAPESTRAAGEPPVEPYEEPASPVEESDEHTSVGAEPVASEEPIEEAALLSPLSDPPDSPAEPVAATEDQAVVEVGWTLLDETEDAPDAPTFVEPGIVAPDEALPALDEALPTADIEDARIVPEETPFRSFADDDLDALIQRLEDAPRIRPDPKFDGPAPAFDETIADDMVSETLARIYAAQQQYAEAAIVYEKLAAQQPEQAASLLARAAELRAKTDGS